MTESVREFASRCARFSRALRLAECEVWDAIAERGEEWQQALRADGRPDHGPRLMKAHNCFNNSARTVFGLTAMDPEGLKYAEGFAQASTGMWWHHAWVVNKAGLAVDRTWHLPGRRYVGVAMTSRELLHGSFAYGKVPGQCLLAYEPCGTPWGPDLTDKAVEILSKGFSPSQLAGNDSAT